MLNKFYLGLGSFLLLGYSVAGFTGTELGDEPRQFVPASARVAGRNHSPGGYHTSNYRSHNFWSWSFRGGK